MNHSEARGYARFRGETLLVDPNRKPRRRSTFLNIFADGVDVSAVFARARRFARYSQRSPVPCVSNLSFDRENLEKLPSFGNHFEIMGN